MTPRYLQLGASLYVPATRRDLAAIANRRKYPSLHSVIFCTEDAVAAGEVAFALANLELMLRRLEPSEMLRFVRVRSSAVLRAVLGMQGVERLTGFVLPKVTRHNIEEYLACFSPADSFAIMPTLESVEVFDPAEMAGLRNILAQGRHRWRVLSLRVGGNDLFNLLGMRRPPGRTLYETPLGVTLAQLVTTFRPHGFNLTAPVFEYLNSAQLLRGEVRGDLAYGLFGKTAIHPRQVPVIESQYRVSARDLEAAEQILDESAPPVFRLHNAMCEPATHRRWAVLVRERARLYGVTGSLKAL